MSGSGRRKPNLRSSVYQGSDGKWHGWVTMGVRPDGKPDRRHREGATETEVTRKVRELEGKRDAGKTSKPGRVPTVAQWMRTFVEEVAPQRVAQTTIDSTYRPKVERWIIPRLGGHRLDRLYPEHLYKFYGSLRKEGLAPNTILQIHRILSRALSIAVREELIGRNPCRLIDAPQREEPENETLTAAEARALLALTAGRRNGTRWSVALALGWKFTRPKGNRRRTVPIPVQLVAPLRQHFADQDAEREAAGAAWQGWDLVWCEPDGRPIDPHDDWDQWKALLAEAGIAKNARLHDARHTSGTLLGEQHVDMHVIQRILGHAQVSTTRIYTDPTDPLTREAADRIGRALWPDAG